MPVNWRIVPRWTGRKAPHVSHFSDTERGIGEKFEKFILSKEYACGFASCTDGRISRDGDY